jgi:hypothetical protein
VTDIVLDQGPDSDWMRMEATVVLVAGQALMLGDSVNPNDAKSWRRALAHTSGDGLSVNYQRDFKNGLALNGVRLITGHQSPDLFGTDPAGVAVGGIAPQMRIKGEVLIEMTPSTELTIDGELTSHDEVSLQLTLHGLQDRVSALEAQQGLTDDPKGGIALSDVRLIKAHTERDVDPGSVLVGGITPQLKVEGEMMIELSPAQGLAGPGRTEDHNVVSLQLTINGLLERVAFLEGQLAEVLAKLA